MKNKLPERLKELRQERGITQTKLMHLLNLGNSTVQRWESGENIPNAEYICILCEFFNCSSDFLLGLKDE